MTELSEAKGAAYSTNSCQPHNEHGREKAISYCSLGGYLTLTSCLPMEKAFHDKNSLETTGVMSPLCRSTEP